MPKAIFISKNAVSQVRRQNDFDMRYLQKMLLYTIDSIILIYNINWEICKGGDYKHNRVLCFYLREGFTISKVK